MDPVTLGAVGLGLLLISKHDAGAKKRVSLVTGRQRLDSVHIQLRQLIEAWEYEGSHNIFIPADGGLRIGVEAAAKQLEYFQRGTSNARTLDETPHGRGAALDVYPVGYDFSKPLEEQPAMRARFEAFGAFAKRFGFVWGGDFRNLKDWPHVELPNWKTIQFRGNA